MALMKNSNINANGNLVWWCLYVHVGACNVDLCPDPVWIYIRIQIYPPHLIKIQAQHVQVQHISPNTLGPAHI